MFDLHSHILPGLDDGPPDWEESLSMARGAVENGIEGMVCTPHWVPGAFENTRPAVLNAFHTFRRKLLEHGIPLKIYPGQELRLDTEIVRRIESGELLSINDTGAYALIELPAEIIPQNLEEFIWDLQAHGITPIIAHPERNPSFQENLPRLHNLVHMGALLQLTAASITGKFGKEAKEFSVLLLKHRLGHILATDAHGAKFRRPRLREGCRLVEKLCGKEVADQMVYELPKKIIQGLPVTPAYDPIPIQQKKSFFSIPFWKELLGGAAGR